MTPEKLEEMTIENAKSISSLTQIAMNTSSDVDKLVTHVDRVLTITAHTKSLHRRVDKLEGHLAWVVRVGIVGLFSGLIGLIVFVFKG